MTRKREAIKTERFRTMIIIRMMSRVNIMMMMTRIIKNDYDDDVQTDDKNKKSDQYNKIYNSQNYYENKDENDEKYDKNYKSILIKKKIMTKTHTRRRRRRYK